MSRTVLITGITVTAVLLAVLILGLREIRRFRSGAPADATNGSATAVPTIRFVNNPQPAPDFALQDLNGKMISSADWEGKVILLNFWATWCASCIAEIPDLIQLHNKYRRQFQVVGLSVDAGSPEDVKRFVQEKKINYPIAIVSTELQGKFGGVMGLPTSFIVDTKGRIVQKHVGLRDPAVYDLEIRALLGLPVEAKIETFDDTGQVLLANAKNAMELPGVDLSKLTPEQKKTALRQLNEQECTCGCDLTLAQCRINDTSCSVSPGLAKHLVDRVVVGK